MSELNIYQKLIEVRKEVPYLKKDEDGYQFKFVSSSQVLGVLKAKMDSLGLLLIPNVIKKTVSDHKTKDGGHNYFTEVEMSYTWVNTDNPEELIPCQWYGQGLDSGEKGVGKAYTYAEKYFLLKFFNIATDKDDPDVFQSKVGGKVLTEPEPITDKQAEQIFKLQEQGNILSEDFAARLKKKFGVDNVDRLDTSQANELINALKIVVKKSA